MIPGFIARDRRGHVALFGRGGSDLSALFLAGQSNARCRLIKDVDGIYDSDPAACSDARRFDEINFSDALAIAGKVVQQKAIAFGRKTGVPFEVAALGENYATTVGSHHSVLSQRHFRRRRSRSACSASAPSASVSCETTTLARRFRIIPGFLQIN